MFEEEPRVLRPRRASPNDAVRPTRAEINLGNLRHNYHLARRALAEVGSSAAIWPVLKADAYGHGAPAVARTLERAGAEGLCVALLEEGLDLRAAGITVPVLVMGGYYGPLWRGLEEAVEHGLTPVLYDAAQIERLAGIARGRGAPAEFHLKVDTGMSRLGVALPLLTELLDRIASTPEVRMTGLMSHLACADAADPSATEQQLRHFLAAAEQAKSRGLAPSKLHLGNSAALLAHPRTHFDFLRPGLMLFGVSPFYKTDHERAPSPQVVAELRPVMRVRTEIVALRTLPPGQGVGYGHSYHAPSERLLATIPLGYADGLPSRALSNRGQVAIRGRLAPIVGIVSMDLTTVDVTEIPQVALGDEVVVLGGQDGPLGSACVSANEIAEALGTIPWEVLTSVSRRVPRFYREP